MLKKLILFRLTSCFLVQTWFVPDETWQVTEVAHYFTYGYGYLCWEWREAIRSFIYPGFFSAIYYLLSLLNLDNTFVLINIPRVVSSVIFAVGDLYTIKFFAKLYGRGSRNWILIFLGTSWFLMYCAPRTLSSCVEMTLLAIALYYFPWNHEKESLSTRYLLWGGLGCAIRPTLAVFLLPFCVKHLLCQKNLQLLFRYIFNVFGILLLSIVLDSLFYGRLTVVPWNFLKFNLLSGLSSHYGKHPWHWYFTQGLPVICGVHLIPIGFGVIKYFKKYKKIFFPCLWGIVIHSLLEHKEFRFLLPILPVLLAIGADSIHTFVKHSFKHEKFKKKKNLLVIIILVIPNTFILLYMGLVHQRGPIDVMHELRNSLDVKEISSVLFLTPCHSTPLYSHLHVNIPIRFLTCEPNLNRIENYEDEADVFFKDPLKWIDREYNANPGQTSNLPTYVIMFDILYETLEPFLMENNYKFRKKIFNSHFYDGNRGQYFHIYKKL
ncbi:UNVERIFIED_CONTAM: hypothetical protein RMT77_000578 [Armadillidium vulgare]